MSVRIKDLPTPILDAITNIIPFQREPEPEADLQTVAERHLPQPEVQTVAERHLPLPVSDFITAVLSLMYETADALDQETPLEHYDRLRAKYTIATLVTTTGTFGDLELEDLSRWFQAERMSLLNEIHAAARNVHLTMVHDAVAPLRTTDDDTRALCARRLEPYAWSCLSRTDCAVALGGSTDHVPPHLAYLQRAIDRRDPSVEIQHHATQAREAVEAQAKASMSCKDVQEALRRLPQTLGDMTIHALIVLLIQTVNADGHYLLGLNDACLKDGIKWRERLLRIICAVIFIS